MAISQQGIRSSLFKPSERYP